MLLKNRITSTLFQRGFKNFGHQRESVPFVTTLWHGFLTITFIGSCMEWKKIGKWIFGIDFEENREEIEYNVIEEDRT